MEQGIEWKEMLAKDSPIFRWEARKMGHPEGQDHLGSMSHPRHPLASLNKDWPWRILKLRAWLRCPDDVSGSLDIAVGFFKLHDR